MDSAFRPGIPIGHALTLRANLPNSASNVQRYQNFFGGINETFRYLDNDYTFLPFGFSGITSNRSGDNQTTQLALPQNALSREYTQALVNAGFWMVFIDMLILNPADKTQFRKLTSFAGHITGGIWTETDIRLEVSSVIDAVGADIPRRRITEDVFGPLPFSSSMRLS